MMSLSMNTPADLLPSFESITMFCIYFICAFYILDFHSFLLYSIFHLSLRAWKNWADAQSKNVNDSKALPITPKAPCQDEEIRHDENDKLSLFEGEVKMVMERLGISCHVEGGKIHEQVGPKEMATLFNEKEASLEEVKEAFDVFDVNSDGYIDAMELRKVLCALGFVHVPERDCQNMISCYDHDGDGRLGFCEFVKLFEKSFY